MWHVNQGHHDAGEFGLSHKLHRFEAQMTSSSVVSFAHMTLPKLPLIGHDQMAMTKP